MKLRLLAIMLNIILILILLAGCLPQSTSEYNEPAFLYIPLDDRPVNYIQVAELSRLAGIRLLMPSRELLYGEQRKAHVEHLWQWINDNLENVDGAILSLDMLVYGGLVASRTHGMSLDMLKMRLAMVKKLAESISGPVYAFATVLRSAASSQSAEEMYYYRKYGDKIFKFGILEHRKKLGLASRDELRELARLQEEIPRYYLADYITRRENNQIVLNKFIQLAGNKNFDYLVIGRDDCYPFGFSSREAREIERLVAEQGLGESVVTYPGADELGFMLLTRAFNDLHNIAPRIYIGYSFAGAEEVIPRYEDVSLGESIEARIDSMGGSIVSAPEVSDLALVVNAPRDEAVKNIGRHEYLENKLPATVINQVATLLARGIPVTLADVAQPNGAEHALLQAMAVNNLLDDLAGYAGWNTAGNSIGTALALGNIYSGLFGMGKLDLDRKQFHQRCLLTRFIDDWGYQSIVRPELLMRHNITTIYPLDPAQERKLSEEAEILLHDFSAKYLEHSFGRRVPLKEVAFPWQRLFEIEFKINN